MGVIVTKDDDKNATLTEKINADLRERAIRAAKIEGDGPDFSKDSEYLKELKTTGRFTWVWFILIALAIMATIFIILI